MDQFKSMPNGFPKKKHLRWMKHCGGYMIVDWMDGWDGSPGGMRSRAREPVRKSSEDAFSGSNYQ